MSTISSTVSTMEVPKSKEGGRMKRLKLDDPATNHYRYEKSKVREIAEKIIDEIEKEVIIHWSPWRKERNVFKDMLTIVSRPNRAKHFYVCV